MRLLSMKVRILFCWFCCALYFVKDLKAGDVITADAVRSVRPGFGVAPKYLAQVIGSTVKSDIRTNTPVSFDSLVKKL